MAWSHLFRFCSWLYSWCSHGNLFLWAQQTWWWHSLQDSFLLTATQHRLSLIFTTAGERGHDRQISESSKRVSDLLKLTRPGSHRVYILGELGSHRALGGGRGSKGQGLHHQGSGEERALTHGAMNIPQPGLTMWLCSGKCKSPQHQASLSPNVSRSFLPS